MTVIREIAVWDFRPGFHGGSYAMAHVVMTECRGRIVRLRTDCGGEGWGEMVFPPSIPAAEADACIAGESGWLAGLAGRTADDILNFVSAAALRGRSWRAAGFGLETAVFDMRAKIFGVALSELFGGAGGAGVKSVDDYFSVSETNAAAVQDRIREAGPERRVIQLKLAVGSRREDAACIEAAFAEMNSGQVLLADANGGWTVDETVNLAKSVFSKARAPFYLEEPCSTYAENRTAAERTGAPVMVDQCGGERRIAEHIISENAVAALCIKPAYLGGLRAARDIRDLCAARGMPMRIDGPWCGDVATAASLHLALGAPPDLLISGADLRAPLALRPVLGGVQAAPGGKIAPPPGPGLGFTPAAGALGPPAAVYHRAGRAGLTGA